MREPRTHGRGRRAALTGICASMVELVALSAVATVASGLLFFAARWGITLVTSTLAFVVNRRWAFRERQVPLRTQARRFAVTLVSAVTMATALFAVLLSLTRLDPRLVHVVCGMTVFAVFTRPMLTRWVFAGSRGSEAGSS